MPPCRTYNTAPPVKGGVNMVAASPPATVVNPGDWPVLGLYQWTFNVTLPAADRSTVNGSPDPTKTTYSRPSSARHMPVLASLPFGAIPQNRTSPELKNRAQCPATS
jgi:hypothetical protein